MKVVPVSPALLVLAGLMAAVIHLAAPSAHGQAGRIVSPTSSRVVHQFDFEERALGNLERIPKFWESLRPSGFPHYAYGEFDEDVGRLAPPSFHLSSEGRNVAYQYRGPKTRVRPSVEYRIEGFVRPDSLRHARSCLAVQYLDRSGDPVKGTLVRSRYVGGEEDGSDWVRIVLHLPVAPSEAYSIGVSAWVMQESTWSHEVPFARHISRKDVLGGAWFDDITVFSVPHVRLASSAAGNVLAPNGPQELVLTLSDDEPSGLRAVLSIDSVDGGQVEIHTVLANEPGNQEATRISVGHLSPGLYHARLEVFARNAQITSRQLTFARLGERIRAGESLARNFGVVIDPRARSDSQVELALLQSQAVHTAKLPVWSGTAEQSATPLDRRTSARLYQSLVRSGFSLTGVFAGPPSEIARGDGAYVRPLVELLASPPESWAEYLAAVVAPNAGAFSWWQVGPDVSGGELAVADPDQVISAVTNLRQAMRPFITMPLLAVPLTTAVEPPDTKVAAQQMSLTFGNEIPIDQLASRLEQFESLGYDQVSVLVEPLSQEDYQRLPRLADWAQRIITLRHAGANTVFVPQTWQVRDTPQGMVTEPTEGYLILRTIADVISDAVPGEKLRVSGTLQSLAFHRGGSSVLAIWDPEAPPGGALYPIQLGKASRQIDLWGRSTELQRDKRGRQLVRVTPMPTLIPDIERWLIELRATPRITPEHVDSGIELVQHELEIAYNGDRPLSGKCVLSVPEAWQVTPHSFTFNLAPHRKWSRSFKIYYPHNEPAGIREVVAQITLTGEGYYLEIPLPIEIGLTDLEVWGTASIEGDDVVLHHVVSNRSSEVLSFRAVANVPGRARQYRPLSNLRPGDTQAVEYRFRNGADLYGREIRLVLREMNDGPRIHNLELVVP